MNTIGNFLKYEELNYIANKTYRWYAIVVYPNLVIFFDEHGKEDGIIDFPSVTQEPNTVTRLLL